MSEMLLNKKGMLNLGQTNSKLTSKIEQQSCLFFHHGHLTCRFGRCIIWKMHSLFAPSLLSLHLLLFLSQYINLSQSPYQYLYHPISLSIPLNLNLSLSISLSISLSLNLSISQSPNLPISLSLTLTCIWCKSEGQAGDNASGHNPKTQASCLAC